MNTTPTDTPETDAACGTGNWIHCVDADFARTLERRARAAEARVKELETDADMRCDEFMRIKAHVQSGNIFPLELISLCDRAISGTKARISLIEQRDKAERELAEARAALHLRPIAEDGPVPEGMVRVYAERYLNRQWLFAEDPCSSDTHFIDIYPPKQ